MAMSNRDRVGRGFEVLAVGLGPFVDEWMRGAMDGRADWLDVYAAREGRGGAKEYSLQDPALQLKMITEGWRVFKDHLSRVEQNFASELRDTRNKWAHNASFNTEDTYRALDTMERLLTAVGATEPADQERELRTELQRQLYEAEQRRGRKGEPSPGVPGHGLKSWREVLPPHEDVATGNFTASEFAADLHTVAFADDSPSSEGRGREYTDAVEFFRRTYLTEGLRDLLSTAVRRISGDANAAPVVNLQTNFGGGKTHSMLALWHVVSGVPSTQFPEDVQDLIGSAPLPATVRRVALVGNHLMPTGTTKPDGTKVNTIWGELAWQLGGAEAFAIVADSDAASTSPGDSLRTLLEAYSPCIILVDEWVAYARQLWGREDLPAGTFDTQFTFAQTLTEVAKTVPGVLLVISIPASHDPDRDGDDSGSSIEVGGPNGQEALKRLQNVVRRVADQWRPASSQESFEIVRRRLFTEPDDQARSDIAAVARQFHQFYAKHTGEFPREVVDPAYESRLRDSFPIHPELFDRLYQDWSTLDRFQRTRGVLRMMSAVVHALWSAQDPSPMILPGMIPLDSAVASSEILQYLPDSWKPIVDADVDGAESTPARIDASRPAFGQRAVTRRLSRSIFMAAAPTLRSAHRGVERHRVWLGAAVPGDVVGNFGSALDLLGQQATYLYREGERYWYDTQASVTRTAADKAEALRDQPEEAWQELVERMRRSVPKHRGGFAGVHVAPESSADIPDTDAARLVVLHPSHPHTKGAGDSAAMLFAHDAFERRGNAQRTNRNMVVFLAPDGKRLDELLQATREFLAWTWVHQRREELNLSPTQVKQVDGNVTRADEIVNARIAETYHWVLVPEQLDPQAPADIVVEKADGANERLAERVTDRLTRSGLLTGQLAPRTIRLELDQKLGSVWAKGHVSVGDLWGYLCRYPYLPRVRDRAVLDDAVRYVLVDIGWEIDGFVLAEGFDQESGRYTGLVVPHGGANFGQITDSTLLVHPDAVAAQQPAQTCEDCGQPAHDGPCSTGALCAECGRPVHGGPCAPGRPEKVDPVPPAPLARNTRFYGVYRVDAERYGRDFGRIGQEILAHLAALDDVDLDVTVEVHAKHPGGFPDDKVRILLENASALKFESFGIED